MGAKGKKGHYPHHILSREGGPYRWLSPRFEGKRKKNGASGKNKDFVTQGRKGGEDTSGVASFPQSLSRGGGRKKHKGKASLQKCQTL